MSLRTTSASPRPALPNPAPDQVLPPRRSTGLTPRTGRQVSMIPRLAQPRAALVVPPRAQFQIYEDPDAGEASSVGNRLVRTRTVATQRAAAPEPVPTPVVPPERKIR